MSVQDQLGLHGETETKENGEADEGEMELRVRVEREEESVLKIRQKKRLSEEREMERYIRAGKKMLLKTHWMKVLGLKDTKS